MIDSVMDNQTVQEKLQALEEVRQDAEKGMNIISGAVRLLLRQENECARTACCPVCQRSLDTELAKKLCAQTLRDKRKRAEEIRDTEAGRLYDYCVDTISQLDKTRSIDLCSASTISEARQAFYVRTGELAEWRQQKLDCMTNMSCFACFRPFAASEFPSFLSRMDHRAAIMERELHMHPKFCPMERPLPQECGDTDSANSRRKRAKWDADPTAEPPHTKSRISSTASTTPVVIVVPAFNSDNGRETGPVCVEDNDVVTLPIEREPSPHPRELMI